MLDEDFAEPMDDFDQEIISGPTEKKADTTNNDKIIDENAG